MFIIYPYPSTSSLIFLCTLSTEAAKTSVSGSQHLKDSGIMRVNVFSRNELQAPALTVSTVAETGYGATPSHLGWLLNSCLVTSAVCGSVA